MLKTLKIYNPMNLRLDGRIEKTLTKPASRSTFSKYYVANARIPSNRWYTLSSGEISRLTSDKAPPAGKSLTVLKLSKSFLGNVHQLFPLASSPPPDEAANSNSLTEIAYTITNELSEYLDIQHTGLAGICQHQLGFPTVTICGRRKKRVGLHIDSWEKKPITTRHTSTNRICINIGNSGRRFIYVNHTLSDLAYLLRVNPRTGNTCAISSLIARLWRRYPGFPVYSLNLEPGDAYVGPTENIIHDACDTLVATDNATLTVLGQFQPK